jgi:RNA polymerase sigma-70 factor (ECF subfamily)
MDRPVAQLAASDDLASLMRATALGDRAAFQTLYQRTSAKLYGICLRLLGSESEAQEVLQDVYVTVWRSAARYDDSKASPITWLAVIARNRSIDRLRQRRPDGEELDAAYEIADSRPLATAVIEQEEDSRRLANCLDQLEQRSRAMIRAAFLDGASYPELAEREAVPLGTMKSWIRRGLMRLKGCLEQ